MSKQKGQNLTEVVIITVLIALAGILALTVLGKNVFSSYSSSNNKYTSFKPFEFVSNKQTEQTNIDGCTGKAGTSCSLPGGGKIDYNEDGSFNLTIDGITLTNLTGNYSQIIDSVGSSGGTDHIAAIIEQIIQQLENSGIDTPEEADYIARLKSMATTSRDIAAAERECEAISKTIMDKCTENYCPVSLLTSEENKIMLDNSAIIAGDSGSQGKIGELSDTLNLLQNENNGAFGKKYPQTQILIQTLKNEIFKLGHEVWQNNLSMRNNYDPKKDWFNPYNADLIINPEASTITDLDGTIICQIGNGTYKANGCK